MQRPELTDLDVAITAGRAAARVAMASFENAVVRYAKTGHDFATSADINSERAAREVLHHHRPRDGVVGEELEPIQGGSRRWLIDPICGTLNFAAGLPLFAVNIALEISGSTAVAAVVEPPTGRVFATDGTRAVLLSDGHEAALRTSPASRLVDINLGFQYPRVNASRLIEDEPFTASYSPRVLASTLALAWVAAGRTAAYVCAANPLGNVHFAAGIALCEAAGGVVTALDGSPLGPDTVGFIAGADADTNGFIRQRLAALAI